MQVDKSHLGLVFAHPRATTAAQEKELRAAGASWIVVVGKSPATWREAISPVRPGDTVYALAGNMVPASRRKAGMGQPAQWSAFLAELHMRGAVFCEVMTGRKSSNVKQLRAMSDEVMRLLRQGGKRLPGKRPAGRKRREWTSDDVKAEWLRRWKSKNYKSDAAVIREAKENGISERMMRALGPSGRH